MTRLVVCCDGTWDRLTRKAPTNVVELYDAVSLTGSAPDGSRITQKRYYHPGVGTHRLDRLAGGIFGLGVSHNIRDCYRFIVENYEPGDELFFFGFSRGAFTARSTVGLIRNAGILHRDHVDRIDEAYRLYRATGAARAPDGDEARRFRRSYSHDEVRIRFIGVWDTVGALGIPGLPAWIARGRWGFHDLKLTSYVDCAYQALSIDEQRRPYRPTPWQQQDHSTGQQLAQVWFAGTHGDVGGGYTSQSLSDITLLWMVGQARALGLGITPGRLELAPAPPARSPGARTGLAPDRFGPITNTRKFPFTLLPAYQRPMLDPPGTGHFTASGTAKDRYERPGADYHPANLAAYLDTGGPVTPIGIG